MLSKPVVMRIDPSLNDDLLVKTNDLVLVGFPEFNDLVGIGLVKNVKESRIQIDNDSPFVMARVSWPSKEVRKMLASFRLDKLKF